MRALTCRDWGEVVERELAAGAGHAECMTPRLKYATRTDTVEGIDGTRIMTTERTAEVIAVQAASRQHEHSIVDVSELVRWPP